MSLSETLSGTGSRGLKAVASIAVAALILTGMLAPTAASAAASPMTATARIQQAGSIKAPDAKQATAQVSVPAGDAYQLEVRESACPVGTAKPTDTAEVEQCRETILVLQ